MQLKSVLSSASLAVLSILYGAGCSAAPDESTSEPTGASSGAISGTCGLTPQASPCNLPRCTADGWEFLPMAKGASCRTTAGLSGTCNGGTNGDEGSGKCIAATTVTSSLYPAYYPVTVLYAPPGNESEVAYQAQSTIGSETDIQDLFKAGVQVQVSGHVLGQGVQVTAGFAGGPVDGTSFEMSKTQSSTLLIDSTQDALAHGGDMYFLWTNAEIDLSQTGSGPVSTALTSRGGASPIIVPVTVAELKNQSLIPAWKQAYLTAMKPGDYQSLLGLDPLVSTSLETSVLGITPDASRYNKLQELQLDGPDQPGDPIVGMGIGVTNEQTNGTVSGKNYATTASVMVDTGFNFFGLLSTSVQAGGTFEWDYQKTTQSKTGTAETATVTLKTTTVGYHDVVEVYFDTFFNSFAFAHNAPSVILSPIAIGTVRTAIGTVAVGEPLTVTFADGHTRTVLTNARGEYRVYGTSTSEGEATIATQGEGESGRVIMRLGEQATLDLRSAH